MRAPLMASGFQGISFMRRPPVEKQREAASMQAVPSVRVLEKSLDVVFIDSLDIFVLFTNAVKGV